MRKYSLVWTIYFTSMFCNAQNRNFDSLQLSTIHTQETDSLEQLLTTVKFDDTSTANLLGKLSYSFAFIQAEKSVSYGQKAVQLSKKAEL